MYLNHARFMTLRIGFKLKCVAARRRLAGMNCFSKSSSKLFFNHETCSNSMCLRMEIRDGGDALREDSKTSVYALVNNKNVKKRVSKSQNRSRRVTVTEHSGPKSARILSPL